jgi:hypothetical protein
MSGVIARITFPLIIALLFLQPLMLNAQQGGEADETERLLRRNWSLFLEYFKTADYNMAKRSGWEVMRLDPARFRTLHTRMVELYDTLATHQPSVEMKEAYGDTIISLLDHGIETFPDRMSEFNKLKGFRDRQCVHE